TGADAAGARSAGERTGGTYLPRNRPRGELVRVPCTARGSFPALAAAQAGRARAPGPSRVPPRARGHGDRGGAGAGGQAASTALARALYEQPIFLLAAGRALLSPGTVGLRRTGLDRPGVPRPRRQADRLRGVAGSR